MTGPEHYKAAERLLAESDNFLPEDQQGCVYLAAAQVHATLALAAATAMPTVTRMMGDHDEITEWGRAIGWTTPREEVPF